MHFLDIVDVDNAFPNATSVTSMTNWEVGRY